MQDPAQVLMPHPHLTQLRLWEDLGLPSSLPEAAARLPLLLHRQVPQPDAGGLEARAARLASLSRTAAVSAELLDFSFRLMDLTSLEATDTPGRLVPLAASARRPDPSDLSCPPVAAVCVHPDLLSDLLPLLEGSSVRACAVAGGFPAARTFLPVKLLELQLLIDAGAQEVDMVADRGAWLSGDVAEVFRQVAMFRALMPEGVLLKVIVETADLGSYDALARMSFTALAAGADMIKTSTGKASRPSSAAELLLMLEVAARFEAVTGRPAGVKVSGGVRTGIDAARCLLAASETLGPAALVPERFRIGASALLADLLRQRQGSRRQ